MFIEDDVSPPVFGLSKVLLNAKIDYITVHMRGRTQLPPLNGKPIWSRKHHGKRLSVHDATAADIDALVATFGNARLIELEVAIDIRPARGTPLNRAMPL